MRVKFAGRPVKIRSTSSALRNATSTRGSTGVESATCFSSRSAEDLRLDRADERRPLG